MPKPDPTEQSRSRRERILDAAFHAFSTRGYRDTAVDDIAGAAETSKGGIYFHFPTKEAIFRELMDTTADKLVGRVERAVALETEPVARAEAAIHTVLTTFAGHRTMARLLFLDTMGAGRVFQAETNALHARFARADPGLPRRRGRRRGGPAARHAARPRSPGSGRSTRSSRAGCSRTIRRGSRTRTRACAPRCCGQPACPRRGSARCRCPARAGRSRRSGDDRDPGRANGARARGGGRLAALLPASGSPDTAGSLASATAVAPSLDPDRPLRRRRRGRPRGGALAPAVGGHGVRRDRPRVGGRGGRRDRFADAEAAWRELLDGARVDRPGRRAAGRRPGPARRDGVHRPASPPRTMRGAPSARARSSSPSCCSPSRRSARS